MGFGRKNMIKEGSLIHNIYFNLTGKRHACKFYGCGRNDEFNYLVMSLQVRLRLRLEKIESAAYYYNCINVFLIHLHTGKESS